VEAEAALASSQLPNGKVRVGDQPAWRSAELEHRLRMWPIYRGSADET